MIAIVVSSTLLVLAGCSKFDHRSLRYCGDKPLRYYKNSVSEIAYPTVHQSTPDNVAFARQPRTVADRSQDEIRDMRLAEAIHLALMNSRIIRTNAGFNVPGNGLLANPNFAASVFDPAIQESGVLFGTRGVEAALSAFDAQWNTSMLWNRNETLQNNAFGGGGPGTTLAVEGAQFNTQLSKNFGYGGLLTVGNNWDYSGNNLRTAAQLFPSTYTGSVSASYRHPLLAGSGTEFTRIAGPIAQSFSGLSGVTQGVVIARINNDIEIADFELAVHGLLLDVENLYWDLYMAYRRYDTAVAARESAYQTWREAKIRFDVGTVKAADEAQARDRLYETRVAAKNAFAAVLEVELRLRRMLGLPVNDGFVIRPIDEPTAAEIINDWQMSLADALTRRVELRRQKWEIKSLELQLRAANSLVRPRMDFVAGYRVNGFGDRLLDDDRGINNAVSTLTAGDQTGWNLGLEMNMPLGFRSQHSQVRNVELRLARARELLAVEEHEVSHELASAFQSLAQNYATAGDNFRRRQAALTRVEKLFFELQEGTITPDPVVRAQASLAEAENAYFQSIVDYNKQIANLHYRTGTLLQHNNVLLAEGGWDIEAQDDAMRRAVARSQAFDNDHLHVEPEEFASPHITGQVELATESLPPVGQGNPHISPAVPPVPEGSADENDDSIEGKKKAGSKPDRDDKSDGNPDKSNNADNDEDDQPSGSPRGESATINGNDRRSLRIRRISQPRSGEPDDSAVPAESMVPRPIGTRDSVLPPASQDDPLPAVAGPTRDRSQWGFGFIRDSDDSSAADDVDADVDRDAIEWWDLNAASTSGESQSPRPQTLRERVRSSLGQRDRQPADAGVGADTRRMTGRLERADFEVDVDERLQPLEPSRRSATPAGFDQPNPFEIDSRNDDTVQAASRNPFDDEQPVERVVRASAGASINSEVRSIDPPEAESFDKSILSDRNTARRQPSALTFDSLFAK